MTTFKAYFKIIYRHRIMLIVSFAIFLFISLTFVKSDSTDTTTEIKKPDIAMFNDGLDQEVFDGLTLYISQVANIVEVENSELRIKDALFFKDVEYVATVHADMQVSAFTIPNSNEGFLMDQYINAFFNTFSMYKANGVDQTRAIALTIQDLSLSIQTTFDTDQSNATQYMAQMRFFNFYVYGFVGVILTGIASVIIAFNDSLVFNRTLISATSIRQRNLQLLLCHIVLSLGVWLLFTLSSFIFFRDIAFTPRHLMHIANSFVFIFPIAALSFLVGTALKSRSAVSGANNVISLGLSFISGAFVPTELLSPVVVTVAKFMPAFWFVNANEAILTAQSFELGLIVPQLLIQILFGIVFISIALAISKQKSMRYNIATKLS